MDHFTGSWSTADHDPTLTEPCDDDFECSDSFQHTSTEPQDNYADWEGFFERFQGEVPGQGHVVNLSDVPVSQEATCGALAAIGLPETSSWSSSSAASTTITPPDSATQPGLDWNAAVSVCDQSIFTPSQWNPENEYGAARFGSLSHHGLGIFLQNDPQQSTAFGDCYQAYNGDLNHYPPPPLREPHHTFRAGPLPQLPYRGVATDDEDDEADATDPCYAKLLWTCLKQAPEHTLSLKALYEWVAQNSQKAKDPKTRGWQNSVRHNLSMNAAFERVPSSVAQGAKKGSLWRLTDKALREGVISTTRYRKDPKRKPERRGHPALKRQISGSKGGQATRAASRRQREMPHVRSMPYLSFNDAPRHPHPAYYDPLISPYSPHSTGHSPQLLMTPTSLASPYFPGGEQEDMLPPLPPYITKPPHVPTSFGEAVKPALTPFEFQQFDPNEAFLFRNYDSVPPDTPSLATEASFITDDCVQGMMSRDLSRETTIF